MLGLHRNDILLGSIQPDLYGYPKFYLTPKEQAYHATIWGSTGSGKSYLLLNVFTQLFAQGKGVCLIDPHNDLSIDILRNLIHRGYFKKQDTYRRLVYIDWGSRLITPFNILADADDAEFELKAKPNELCPDATLLLERAGATYPIVVEVDRGTEPRKFFKDKVRRLVSYSQSHDSLTIAIVDATQSPKRALDLVRWTEQELTAMGAVELKDIFLFASFDTEQEEPERIFCHPMWHTPFSTERVSLL